MTLLLEVLQDGKMATSMEIFTGSIGAFLKFGFL